MKYFSLPIFIFQIILIIVTFCRFCWGSQTAPIARNSPSSRWRLFRWRIESRINNFLFPFSFIFFRGGKRNKKVSRTPPVILCSIDLIKVGGSCCKDVFFPCVSACLCRRLESYTVAAKLSLFCDTSSRQVGTRPGQWMDVSNTLLTLRLHESEPEYVLVTPDG